MLKRGQVTLFVIIAILIIGAVAVFMLFRSGTVRTPISSEQAQKIVASQVAPVRDHVEGCMEIVVIKTLNTLGRQGGYVLPRGGRFSMPTVMADAPFISYALFYDPSRGYLNQLPSVEEEKNELAAFLGANLDFVTCIDDFSQFKKDVDVSAGNLTIDRENLDIGETSGEIIIPFIYPLVISRDQSKTLVDNYELKIPINLARLREVASRIVNKIATGQNDLAVVKEENDIEWQQLRSDYTAEKIFISAEAYTEVPTNATGIIYNEKNLLFNLEYQNLQLDKPYNFYFLVGEKS